MNAKQLARALQRRKLAGVKFAPANFTPSADHYKGKLCHGVRVEVTDRNRFRSVFAGLEMARAIARMYPGRFQLEKLVGMTGSEEVEKAIRRGDSVARIVEVGREEFEKFIQMRQKYLLYP